MRRGRDAAAAQPSARTSRDRWLVAYADMVTLLFACFASLYAARLDFVPKTPATAASSRSLANTVADSSSSQDGPIPIASQGAIAPAAPLVDLARQLEAVIHRGDDVQPIELRADARGLVISLPEAGAFPVGRADLSPAAASVIRDVADVLRRVPNSIRVEGHTDDVPIHTVMFASNWELSTARATRVVQFLIEDAHLPPARLSAAGYGEFHPRQPNDSAAARARNRRVDIVVLNAATDAAQEPHGPQ